MDFSGKRVLVTGGGGAGAGRQISLYLSKLGAEVYALGRSKSRLESLQLEDPKIKIIPCDLADWEGTRKAVQPILPVHCLVNNAAIYKEEKFAEATRENMQEVFDINLFAPINLTQLVANDLVKRGLKGSVVNISADGVNQGFSNALSYNLTKSALDHVSRCAAAEYSPKGIRFNNINPGLMDTEMSKPFQATDVQSEERAKQYKTSIPLQRVLKPSEVAPVVAFLLSDMSIMINAQSVAVDGGRNGAFIFATDVE